MYIIGQAIKNNICRLKGMKITFQKEIYASGNDAVDLQSITKKHGKLRTIVTAVFFSSF